MYKVKTLPQLSFEAALKLAFSRLTDFKGRSRRSEYWYCYLAVFLVSILTGWIPIVGSIISLVLALFMLPLTFRRLHDTGRSGWWWGAGAIGYAVIGILSGVMIAVSANSGSSSFKEPGGIAGIILMIVFLLAALAYSIAMIVFLTQDSEKRPNKYGPSPKYLLFKV